MNFCEKLVNLFRLFLRHGYCPDTILTCALAPLVKDPNGDICASKNYRAIGISSLILMIFDLCILILFTSELCSDPLQYGFEKECSTVQCTWTVLEVTSYFLKNGSDVYECLLDFSKAFDKVGFSQLFRKLIDRKIPFIFLRLLLYIYRKQTCYVRWNSVKSECFKVRNGVRQGAIISPTLFCVYLDTLLQNLRNSGFGCHVGNIFMGAFGYADYIILLAPTRHALQLMLKICEKFAKSHDMLFSTDIRPEKSKTKCLYFTENQVKPEPQKVILNGDPLPWVPHGKHLGNELNTAINIGLHCPDTSHDLLMKHGIFFDRVYSLKQSAI